MDDLDKKARELEGEMRKEAVRRLKTIEPSNPALAEEFRADGTIYVQDISIDKKEGRRFRKANKPEMEVVRYMKDDESPINTLFSKFTHLSFNLGKTNSDGRV